MARYFNKERFFDYYIPFLLFFGSFTWKYCFIELRDIYMDEPFTLFFARQPVSYIWNMSLIGEPHPPLFTLMVHFWIKWFGIDAATVRLLPLFFNSLTVVFLYKTAQKFSGNIAAVLTSFLFIFSSIHFYFALETRAYSLLSLCAACTIYLFLKLKENPEHKGYFIALLLTNLVMVYCHHFSWLLLFNEFLFALAFFRNKSFFKRIFINLGLVFIAYLPITISAIRQVQKFTKGTCLVPPKEGQVWDEFCFWLNGEHMLNRLLLLAAIGISVLIILIMLNKYRPLKKSFEILLFYMIWFLVPFLIMYYVSFWMPMFSNRYILFNSIPFYLFIGAFAQLFFGHSPIAGWLVTAYIAAKLLLSITIGAKDFNYREVRKSVAMVKEKHTPGTYIFLYPVWTEFPFNYYYNRSIFTDPEHKDELMAKEKIVQIWGIETCRSIVEQECPDKIIFYEDGTFSDDSRHYLDSLYTRTDSVFFPQTTAVSVFVKKQK